MNPQVPGEPTRIQDTCQKPKRPLDTCLLLFLFPLLRRLVTEDLALIYVIECFAYVFLKEFNIVSSLTFRSLIHLEFIFVYGVRECSLCMGLEHFTCSYPVFPAPFIEEAVFAHCIVLPQGYGFSSGNLDSSLCFIQPRISHDIL